jgi:thiol-disulfide isomerase/thioredoxin
VHDGAVTDRARHSFPVAALVLAVVLTGCTSAGSDSSGSPPAPTGSVPSATSGTTDTPPTPTRSTAPSATAESPESAAPQGIVLDQPWATAPLVDVSTGASFRIADHAGKVIILETMAIWCSNCRAQQRDVKTALGELPAESVVYVVLDVDPNEDGPSLASYREQQGFDGRYAIAGTTVARALAADFGDQVLNPPSTPIVFIGTDGRVTLTEFGHKSPDELVALARAHGA